MRIISKKRLRGFAQQHGDVAHSLEKWERILRYAAWESLQDVRRVYPHADAVTVASGSIVTIFNFGGNKYRLIVALHYNTQRAYVLRFLRHAEYSKESWKDTL